MLLPLLKEMRFIIKKGTKQFLLVYKKINKSIFYENKKLFNKHDIDVNKILVSKEESYGTKKFA